MRETQSSKSPFRASFITVSSPDAAWSRAADGCEWKACSALTSTQPPSPSLVTPGTPPSNLLEGQSGEEGQLVVRSGGAGRGAAPDERTEVCSQAWERGKLCAQGVFLLTQTPHSLRQVYLRGRRPC